MSNYIHCPRNQVTPHLYPEQIQEKNLCDFCWNEYCFCWSEYFMSEWYKMQTKHDQQNNHKPSGDRSSESN